jgi:phytoene dehydrogenase-like protein
MDKAGVSDPFVRNWLDLLCFLLSGLPANGTIAAEVAFMFSEWYRPDAALEFPRGGSQALVDALVRGVTKRGGEVRLGAHVESIEVEGGRGWGRRPRATGVRLRGGGRVTARRAVVSNAATPDMLRLLPPGAAPDAWRREVEAAPLNPSFMHLHLGFDAAGLEGLDMHHLAVERWEGGVTQPQNVVLVSVPSVVDPSLAPPGKHTLHAYTPATEPYDLWAGLDRRGPEYAALKEARAAVLWRAVERVIPDIRARVEVEMVGTPRTHERFLRRAASRGSYGPAYRAGEQVFPFGTTPVEDLLCCGDFTFPGIGLPAVAASGAIVANTLVPLSSHLELLRTLGL